MSDEPARCEGEFGVSEYLAAVKENWPSRNSEPVSAELLLLKRAAVARGDESDAKRFWCLGQILTMQDGFIRAFQLMRRHDFYHAWCALEEVELAHHFLLRHRPDSPEFEVQYIAEKVAMYQGLFPYKVFFSPEILELEKKCGICGSMISIRTRCGHEVGEIYGGEMCIREVTRMEFLGTAMVEKPVQKYSVAFLVDPETGESFDQYDYSVVRYLADRLESPFHDWSAELTKRRHPHQLFGHVGKYDQCPCESGQKYKFCCYKYPEGVLRPHWQFEFSVVPSRHMLRTEYAGYGKT